MKVGNVDLEAEYNQGRDEANKLLVQHFGPSGYVDFVKLFSDPEVDHLRPKKKYVGLGSRTSEDSDQEDVEDGNFAPGDDDADTDLAIGPMFQPESSGEKVVDMRDDAHDFEEDLGSNNSISNS